MNRPLCNCGNVCKPNGFSKKDGRALFNTYCRSCAKRIHGKKERPPLILKLNGCVICNFKPEHPCQIDIDHIDGNHNNNSPENLQSLCANCHRLKTFNCRDWFINHL